MDEERFEELAAMNALRMLENDEKRALDGAIARDKDLRMLSLQLDETTAELGCLVKPVEPPANMKKRIRAKMRATGVKGVGVSRGVVIGGAGWALAACFALASVWLWKERAGMTQQLAAASRAIAPVNSPAVPVADDGKARTLEEELKKRRDEFEAQKRSLAAEIESSHKREEEAGAKIAQLTTEVKTLKEQEQQSQLQIVTPAPSKVWEYRRCEMLVVWDQKRSQGVLVLDKMPKAGSDKDYQLWVIDPNKPDPVSAGVVAVDSKGAAKTTFKPVEPVTGEARFALSVEKKGGVPKREGEMLMTGP